MPPARPGLFVLTGGPGAGKTSVIEALATHGEYTAAESGRAVIASYAQRGLPPPWLDPSHYADLMLERDLAAYRDAAASDAQRVFFDRGVPDLIGYLRLMGRPAPRHLLEAVRRRPYASLVFVFPPWPDIYVQDEERHQDYAEASRTHAIMVEAYSGLGYELVEVPRDSIERRVEFILSATFR